MLIESDATRVGDIECPKLASHSNRCIDSIASLRSGCSADPLADRDFVSRQNALIFLDLYWLERSCLGATESSSRRHDQDRSCVAAFDDFRGVPLISESRPRGGY